MTQVDDLLRSELRRLPVAVPDHEGARRRVVQVATRRRHVRRALAGGAALVVGLVALGPLTSTEPLSTRVDTIAPEVPETPAPPEGDRRSTEARSVTTVAGSPRPETGAEGRPAPTAEARPAYDATTPPAASDGCEVEGYDDAGVNVKPDGSPGGLSSSEPPSCTYTATRAGGYVASGKWRLEIRRGPYSIVASSAADDAPCAPVGFIQPGDTVTLTVLGGIESSRSPSYVRAGPDRSC